MSKANLKLDWCSAKAARYACEKWHYSHAMPSGKTAKIGVWERGVFVGCIIFGCGATPEIASPFGLKRMDVCELVRVALTDHESSVTRMIRIAIAMLRQQSPNIKIIVSFADSAQGHHGGIYQGGNWFYIGSFEHHTYRVNGRIVHPKTLHSRYGVGGQSVPWLRRHVDPSAERLKCVVKHKYAMPLDPVGSRIVEPMAKPYPKRAGSIDSDATANHADKGGATPTPALSNAQLQSPQQVGA